MVENSRNAGGKKGWSARENMWYILLLAAYLLVGALASHPFDDAGYAQNAQFFYFLRIPPFLSLPMGAYYDVINIGGYFFTILLYVLHIQNVITIQLGVKIPFIIFSFLTAFIVFKIGKSLGFDGRKASLLLLTSPIYFFTALIYGSAIITSVFFLVAASYLMIRGRNVSSAAFYGMAIGSYLYPAFAVPFLLRYFWLKQGRKEALKFLAVSSIFAAIGQILIFMLYLSRGVAATAPSSPQGYLAPYSYITYYSPLDFLSIFGLSHVLPGETLPLLYYLSALIASFSYFAIPREKVNIESVIIFLFIQGILFSSLAPYNLPSYFAAEIPLAIIVSFMYRRWIFVGLTWLSSLFSFIVMETINPIGFLIYFLDLNHRILKIDNHFPSWVVQVAGSLYGISILLNLLFIRKKREGKSLSLRKTLAAQSSVISAIVVVAIVVLISVSGSIPSGMFYAPQVQTFEAGESAEIVHGNLLVTYSEPLELEYGNYEKKYISATIEYFPQTITMYSESYTHLSQGNNSYPLTIFYPFEDANLTLFSPNRGNISVVLENSSGRLIPSYSHVTAGDIYGYSYIFSTILDGNYSLEVRSDIPYYSSSTSPSLTLKGYFALEGMMIDGTPFSGSLPGYMVSDHISVEFQGEFLKVPPELPPLYFYVNPDGAPLYYPYVVLGGFTFAAIIIAAAVFVRRV